jgi:peptidoglycan/xylan/chitin deacetylase (PgdA/CDA1 family)
MNNVPGAPTRRTPLWQRASPRRRRHAILCFHDIRDRDWLHRFLRDLVERATVVSLASLVDGLPIASGPEPCVAATFDDGYKSIRTIVEPVCSELNLPFTTFVCGEVLRGGPAPWYERVGLLVQKFGSSWAAKYWALGDVSSGALVSALKEAPKCVVLRGLDTAEADASIDSRALCIRFMTEEDLAAVAQNPLVTVGSHTYSHPILANLDSSEQRTEIQRGLDALREVCGSSIEFFAYPNGKPEDFNDTVVQALRDAGLRAAFTTEQRPLLPTDDVMRLPRLGISEGDPIGKLELKWTLPWLSVGDIRENTSRRRYRGSWSSSD